jgi:hypothetical protein
MEVIIYKARADVAIDLGPGAAQSLSSRAGKAFEMRQAAMRR